MRTLITVLVGFSLLLGIFDGSLGLLRFLLVLFTFRLRLHDIVHQVVNVLIINLLVRVIVLGSHRLLPLGLALVVDSLLLTPLTFHIYTIKMIHCTIFGIALAFTMLRVPLEVS